MKPLVKMLINGLALVGAHEIYKEYNSRKTSEPVIGSRDHNPTNVFQTSNR